MNETEVQKKSLGYYFFKGEGTHRFFDMSATLIGYVSSFFTIHLLSVFQFGTFQLLLAFVSLVDSLDINNLDGPIAVEMRHHFSNNQPEKAKRIFWEMAAWRIPLSILVSLAVFFGADLIAHWYGKDIGLLIKIMSPFFFLAVLESMAGIFLKAIFRFSYWAGPAIREVAKLVVVLTFVLSGKFDLTHLAIAHIIGLAVEIFVLVFFLALGPYLKTFGTVKAHGSYLMFDFIKTHGKWMLLNYALTSVFQNTTPWFIKFFINTEAVGFYSLAVNLVAMIQNLVPIDGVTQIFFARIGKHEELAFLFKRSVKYMFWIGVIFAIGGFIFVPIIVGVLFPQYGPSMLIFRIMVLAMPIYAVWKVLRSVLVNLREYKALSMRIIYDFILDPVSAVIFLPLFQLPGIAFDNIFGSLFRSGFLYYQLVKKHSNFKIKLRSFFVFNHDDKELLGQIFGKLFLGLRRLAFYKVF